MNKFIDINGNLINFATPVVMGILNITPDSFYAGSRITIEEEALKRARQILEEGGTIIDIGGQTVGIIVDAVNEVVQMPGASIDPPPPTFILEAQYIEGIGKMEDRLVILLNIDRILTSQEAIQLKATAQ